MGDGLGRPHCDGVMVNAQDGARDDGAGNGVAVTQQNLVTFTQLRWILAGEGVLPLAARGGNRLAQRLEVTERRTQFAALAWRKPPQRDAFCLGGERLVPEQLVVRAKPRGVGWWHGRRLLVARRRLPAQHLRATHTPATHPAPPASSRP